MKNIARLLHRLQTYRFVRFCLVGLTGVCVDMAALYLLHDPARLGWNLTMSKLIAAEVAMIHSFVWNDAWTFGDISRQQSGWTHRLKRLLRFNVVGLSSMALNVVVLNILTRTLPIYYLAANLTAIAMVTGWTFWMNRTFNWRKARVAEADA